MHNTVMHTATEHLVISAAIRFASAEFPDFSFLAAFSISTPESILILMARYKNGVSGLSGGSAGGGLFSNFSDAYSRLRSLYQGQ